MVNQASRFHQKDCQMKLAIAQHSCNQVNPPPNSLQGGDKGVETGFKPVSTRLLCFASQTQPIINVLRIYP